MIKTYLIDPPPLPYQNLKRICLKYDSTVLHLKIYFGVPNHVCAHLVEVLGRGISLTQGLCVYWRKQTLKECTHTHTHVSWVFTPDTTTTDDVEFKFIYLNVLFIEKRNPGPYKVFFK